MTKRPVDEIIDDICGDKSSESFTEDVKILMAALIFIYSRDVMKEPSIPNDPEEWFSGIGLTGFFNWPSIITSLKKSGILNSAGLLRKKDLDDGTNWILFAMTLGGDLECKFDVEKKDYYFKNTEQGNQKAMEIINKLKD